MNILIAVDSFKGSASSLEIGQAIKTSLDEVKHQQDNVEFTEIADGGEGSIAVIASHLGGTYRQIETTDPSGQVIQIIYLITEIKQRLTAVIESASIIGLNFIKVEKNQGYQGSTYGIGLVMKDAMAQGVKEIILTMGGSATTDGGLGMLQALGANFYDEQWQRINHEGNPLINYASADWSQIRLLFKNINLRIATDVTNLYHGKRGAAVVFGKQKGLSEKQMVELDQQLKKVQKDMEASVKVDLQKISGSGASGGLSGALVFLGGTIESGFGLISGIIDFKEMVRRSDLIITGEGSLDGQSSQGKVIQGICEVARVQKVPVVAICGRRDENLGELEDQLVAAFSIQRGPITVAKAIEKERTLKGVSQTSRQIYQLLTLFSS